MICFACQNCGKRQSRPEREADTLIFCNCGTSNRVPWEGSGLDTPPATPGAESPAPASSLPESEEFPLIPFADGKEKAFPARTARPTIGRHDPAFCLNHQETAKQQTCADCEEGFCEDCIVIWQGQVLCGPCKNFRIRQSERPADLSLMALSSAILAFAGGIVGFFVAAVAVQAGAPAVGFLSVTPEAAALVLGLTAIRRIENDRFVKGRPLAMIGIVAALVGAIMLCLITIIVDRAKE